MENILVVGATGTTGKKVVSLLKASQYFEPVAMVRKESQVDEFLVQDIKTVVGDLTEDVSHTVLDVDKIVFAAGSGGENVVQVDQEGAKKIIDAAKAGGIRKFVMLSSMGADQPGKVPALKEYLVAKQNADEYLQASAVPYVIIRPGSLTNEKGTGRIQMANSLDNQGSISREDVAKVLTKALNDDGPINEVFEIIAGNDLISWD
ncbi:SDR family oxidoreductase [Arenibacter aquaticus]|uniref:SDR family oxidoreductase n=1 Tax=Arenibacter aquaticus TaxID=2489054 RepID=A0A3S0AK43_9FLAO|nr:SDR family oxidoreductase [Arenibacter aquaticus]RTE52019.1 SDR family oxidoreductase [Arenibacter aquaticus]